MTDIELFSYEACPFAQRTRIILNEKKVKYKLTEIDLQNRPSWWKELSPLGKVPLVRHKGKVIYESRIINEYIEELIPEPRLMPKDLYSRAIARIWIDYCDTYLLPTLHSFIQSKDDKKKQDENKIILTKKLLFIENEAFKLSDSGSYFMGNELSLVDIQFIPFFERFPCYEYFWNAKIPKECSRILNWINVMKENKNYLSTANSLDFHMERYSKYNQ